MSIFSRRVTFITCVLTISWLVLTSIAYLISPGYFDHCEPAIASLSWLVATGSQDLYPSFNESSRYSFHYGPLGYLLNAIPLLLAGPSIAMSKLMGVTACLGSVLVIYLAIRTKLSKENSIFLIGLICAELLTFRNYGYWNRPDPFLLFLVSIKE